MNEILIGPAGSGGGELSNFENIKKAGADAVEIEFVHSIWMKKENARQIAELNKKLGLKLSIHAPYYLNLNSEDKSKIKASELRILKCCEIGHYLSSGKDKTSIVFHAGFYLKDSKEKTYENIRKEVLYLNHVVSQNNWQVVLCPETTGKPSQFGDLDELIKLIKETKCGICVDFSHLKARYNGKINYDEVMKKISELKQPLHAHFSGIEYTEKGERRHILTNEKDIKELFHYLNKYNISLTIINESPDPLGDALKMKRLL